jgi:hypothetical protein
MKILLILYILALTMLSGSAKSQQINCGDFKIGSFKLEITNYNLPSTIVYRNEKIQKESSDGADDLEGTIEWKSDCSYELRYLNGPPEMIDKAIFVEIISFEGQKAICTSTFEDLPGVVLEFKMEKLE